MFKVDFEDQQQDLLYLYIDTDGTIRHCGPFHHKLYTGDTCTNYKELKVGGKVEISHNKGHLQLKYPIESLTPLITTVYDHVRRGEIRGYAIHQNDEEYGILLEKDVPGRKASDLWRAGEIIFAKKSFFKS
ncbi:MAG: hypothetical protein JWO03_901 [Bacteroidetes bacterium]|nr:hypothetical protein [Bacteroidota bacterium]